MERIQKVIASAGIASRRKAEELIKQGLVKVNGQQVDVLGMQVSKDDIIEVNGKVIQKEEHVYYVINKPKKVVCTSNDEHDRAKVIDLIDCQERIFPVGRLDYDSTGILILTNDGEFSNLLTHPRYHLPKTYRVTVKGILTKADLLHLKRGVVLDDGYKTQPCDIKLVNYDQEVLKSTVEMTIYEGKNRQIRRMMEALGFLVTKLHRLSFGPVRDDQMGFGDYRRLKPHEIKLLKEMATTGKKQ